MIKLLYAKLAVKNIQKNRNIFVPFFIATTIMISMYYMLQSIKMQADDHLFTGSKTMRVVLGFGLVVIAILAVIVLFYTDKFLIKQRSREFGLYSLLGMEKKHIAKIVTWELLIIGGISLVAGFAIGMLFSKLLFMLLLNIIEIKTDFAFQIEPEAIRYTMLLFGVTFFVIIIANCIRVFALKPIDLMQSSHAGEREPKAKWLLAIVGFGLLGIGYYLALSVDNPLQTMINFFIAVICVVIGTYLIFLSGSIALLKLFKKNKRIYYHKKRFITISGMIYRMKQNAIGLANICILSTAVLVLLSSTISLYVGIEDMLKNIYPRDVNVSSLYVPNDEDERLFGKHYNYDIVVDTLEERAKQYDVTIHDLERYYKYEIVGGIKKKGNHVSLLYNDVSKHSTNAIFMTVKDYNNISKDKLTVNKGEAYVYSENNSFAVNEVLEVEGVSFQIAGLCANLGLDNYTYISAMDVTLIVVSEEADLLAIRDAVAKEHDLIQDIVHIIRFDLNGAANDKISFCTGLRDVINKTEMAHLLSIDDIFTMRPEFFGLYGGMFFIGVFLGSLFLVVTVMIIYYKQLSEGYEDRERFQMMQKVGMSKAEVKQVIRSQILQVFFLPIVLAIVHIMFAFKIIKEILAIMSFVNTPLYITATLITVFVFFVVYYIVYMLTARTYYKITAQKQ